MHEPAIHPPRIAPAERRTGASKAALRTMAVMALGAAFLFADAPRAAADEWRSILRQQLLSQYGCRLERFVLERQVPLGGDITREGRIQCVDGREIDYAQPNILLKFELRLCNPTVC